MTRFANNLPRQMRVSNPTGHRSVIPVTTIAVSAKHAQWSIYLAFLASLPYSTLQVVPVYT